MGRKAKRKRLLDQANQSTHTTQSEFTRWLIPVGIALLTVAAFFSVLQNDFVNWDDRSNLFENPNYRGLGWSQIRWMFTTFHMTLYRPLTWLTLGFDYIVWGMDPFGYHLTSLLFHAANAILFYFVALRLLLLTMASPEETVQLSHRAAAGFAALLFSLHPLRVEAVAWASARNDLVSAFFFLATLLLYLKAASVSEPDSAQRRWMGAAVMAYALSLLAKGSGMALPAILVILDIYPLRRLGGEPRKWFEPSVRRIWWEKLPFVLLGLSAGALAIISKYEELQLWGLERYGVRAKIALAMYGLVLYLWKAVFPLRLSPFYELPQQIDFLDASFLLCGLTVLIITMLLLHFRKRWPAGLALWMSYAALIFPVAGILQFSPQLGADRYSYLSNLGWATLAGAGVLYCRNLWANGRILPRTFTIAKCLAVILLSGIAALTWKQVQVWHDTEALWKHALTVSGESSMAHHGLANAFLRLGEVDKAIDHYRKALEINPNSSDSYTNLANALAMRGEYDEAIKHYRKAMEIDPADSNIPFNLGSALELKGNFKEAVQYYEKALNINPTHPEAHFKLANSLVRQERFKEAIDHYQQALQLKSDLVEAHNNLGRVLAAQGQLDQAMEHFREALRVQPDFTAAHESLAQALAEQGKRDEAIQEYNEALRILQAGRQESGSSNVGSR